MAREAPRLLKENAWPTNQLVVMGGHKEGVMAYGTSLGGRRSAELLRSYFCLQRRESTNLVELPEDTYEGPAFPNDATSFGCPGI